MESFYNIGNIITKVCGNCNLEQFTQNRAFKVFRIAPSPTKASITLNAEVEDVPYTILHRFEFQNRIPCFFATYENGYVFRMQSPDGELLRMYFDGENHVQLCPCNDYTLLTFALWMAFNLIGCKQHSLSIHSSCITFRGEGILFLGESGTGKSTQSKLWMETFEEAKLLNDDGPFLASQNGKYQVFGSPWSGKTACYHQLHLPIKAIVRIVQAPFNRITPLSTLHKIGALIPSFPPALSKENKFQQAMLEMVSQIVTEVPIYCLECLPNADAVLTTFRTLYPDSCKP